MTTPRKATQESNSETTATFWEHLDVLRSVIVRSLLVVGIAAVAAFLLKEPLFRVVLAPSSSQFFVYQWLGVEPFSLHLMNTGLAEQFMIHMKTALYVGLLAASPYVLYELFGFVSPALYANERRYSRWIVVSAYLMFMLGTAVNYLLIFPLTVRFLGTYQVSPEVTNMLTIQSYTDTLIGLSLVMGVVFELPVVCGLMGHIGVLSAAMMKEYRRHAIVAILVVAAIITPTTDIFTLIVVALPIYLLYEASIGIVRIVKR